MPNQLAKPIEELCSADAAVRQRAAEEIYRLGRAAAGIAISSWWSDNELGQLLSAENPAVTVGLAVARENQQLLFQSEDAKEGLAAYVEKRPAQFKAK